MFMVEFVRYYDSPKMSSIMRNKNYSYQILARKIV